MQVQVNQEFKLNLMLKKMTRYIAVFSINHFEGVLPTITSHLATVVNVCKQNYSFKLVLKNMHLGTYT